MPLLTAVERKDQEMNEHKDWTSLFLLFLLQGRSWGTLGQNLACQGLLESVLGMNTANSTAANFWSICLLQIHLQRRKEIEGQIYNWSLERYYRASSLSAFSIFSIKIKKITQTQKRLWIRSMVYVMLFLLLMHRSIFLLTLFWKC